MALPETLKEDSVPISENADSEQPATADTGEDLSPPPLPSSETPPDVKEQEAALQRPVPAWAQAPEDTEDDTAVVPVLPIESDTQDISETVLPAEVPMPPWLAHRQRIVSERPADTPASGATARSGRGDVTYAPPASAKRDLHWLWSGLLGALLGGILGFGFSMLAFAMINGALDVSRARGVEALRAQLSGLSTEMSAMRADTSDLQSNMEQLHQEVEALSGLPARLDRVEAEIGTLNADVEALQQEDIVLRESLDSLATELATVQEQTERTISFFEQLRDLLTDTFGQGP